MVTGSKQSGDACLGRKFAAWFGMPPRACAVRRRNRRFLVFAAAGAGKAPPNLFIRDGFGHSGIHV
jgi:hypothetical protein